MATGLEGGYVEGIGLRDCFVTYFLANCSKEFGTREDLVDGPEEGRGKIWVGVAKVGLHFVGVFSWDSCLAKDPLAFPD